MNFLASSKPFLQCSGQSRRPEKQLISLKESLNIVGPPWKNWLIVGGRISFIQMIGRRPLRHSPGQSALESHTAQYTACDAQMESTGGITRWANLCVIPTAISFSGMASRSTSMSGNEQKTPFARRAPSLATRRESQL